LLHNTSTTANEQSHPEVPENAHEETFVRVAKTTLFVTTRI
jgi:hypothetical protein